VADFSKTPDLLVSRPGLHKQVILIIISKVSARKQKYSFQIVWLHVSSEGKQTFSWLFSYWVTVFALLQTFLKTSKPSCPNRLLVLVRQ